MVLAMAFALAAVHLESGTRYYLAPSGSDAADGRSPAHAWRTLARASRAAYGPGDQLLLSAGATFAGSLTLAPTVAGTPERPIVIRTNGKPFAHIVSSNRTAVAAAGGGIEISDLVLEGRATKANKNHHGIAIIAIGDHGERRPHIRIDTVDVSGFGGDGVVVGSDSPSLAGYDDVVIRHVVAHGNFGSGISTVDHNNSRARGYALHNVTLTDCLASGNHSGSGIVVSGIDGGRIEYCRATENDGKGGGVGIWAWSARHVNIRYCIADHTRTGGGDGGGFDLDGACVECAMDRCLAYENAGPGFMHCDYPWATPTHDNAFRHCASVNDGRKAKGSEIGFGFVTWGSGLDRCVIAESVAVVTKESPHPKPFGVLFVSQILGSQAPKETPHIRACEFSANTVLVDCSGVEYISNALPATNGEVMFENNELLRTDRGPVVGSTLMRVRLMALGHTPCHLTDPHKLSASPFIQFAESL